MPTSISLSSIRTKLRYMSFAGEKAERSDVMLLQNGFAYLHLTTGTTNKFEIPIIMPDQVKKNAKITRFGFIFTCPDPAGTPSMVITVPALKRVILSAEGVLKATGTAQSAVDLITSAGSVGTGYASAAAGTVFAPTITTPAALSLKASSPSIGDIVAGSKGAVLDFREEDCEAVGASWTNNEFNPLDMAMGQVTMANQEAAARWWGVHFYVYVQRKRY